MEQIAYVVTALLAAGYLTTLLVRKLMLRGRQQRIDSVLESVHHHGRVVYKKKVYTVKEICDRSHYQGKEYKICKDLIITKPGEEQLFKVSIDDVEPYRDTREK
ncbi:MAG: hypothetical protein AB1805_01420 [Nitrospirota bacterium]